VKERSMKQGSPRKLFHCGRVENMFDDVID
jgi:hypothetical protein